MKTVGRIADLIEPTIRIVASLTEAEEQQVLVLLDRAFRGKLLWFGLPGPRIDHLRWKLRDAPWTAVAVLMELGPRIIGFQLNLRRRVLVRSTEYVARDGTDLAIDPEFQGRGLLRPLQKHVDAYSRSAFDLTLGYDEHPASRHTMAERGRQDFGNRLRAMVKPVDISRSVSSRPLLRPARMVWLFGRRGLARVRRAFHRAPRVTWSIVTISRFDERINAFFEQAAIPFEFIQRRTAASLNWRYCDPRGGDFTVRLAEEEGKILGYAVLVAGGEVGHVADILALPGRWDVVWTLAGDAVAFLERAGVASIRCWMAAVHPYNDILRLWGFLPTQASTGVTYGAHGLDEHALSFLSDRRAAIHLTLGDSDHI